MLLKSVAATDSDTVKEGKILYWFLERRPKDGKLLGLESK